jgi:hypothetical protein
MTHGIAAGDETAKRMADQNAALPRRDMLNNSRELIHDALERPWARRRIAPRKTGTIVGTHTGESRDGRSDARPAQRRCCDAGFENHWKMSAAAARDVQPVAANIDELTRGRISARRGTTGGALIQHARRGQRGEHANDDDQLLEVRGAR